MVKQTKVGISLFLAISTMIPQSTVNAQPNNFFDGLLIAGAAALGVGLVAGATVMAVDYFSETDEQLINRVESELLHAKNVYQEMLIDVYARTDADLETRLCEIAAAIWYKGQSQISYIANLRSTRDQLRSSLQALNKREDKLRKNAHHAHNSKIEHKIGVLISKVEGFLPQLCNLYTFMDDHRSFFLLYEDEIKLGSRYGDLIAIAQAGFGGYMCDQLRAVDAIKQLVLCTENSKYPFTRFVDRIKSDIRTLKQDIRNLSYYYAQRQTVAQRTVDTLSSICNVIMTDSRYAHEQYEMEQERLEQERQRLLREQFELSKEQLRLERERIRVQEERLRVERERLRQDYNVDQSNITLEFGIKLT